MLRHSALVAMLLLVSTADSTVAQTIFPDTHPFNEPTILTEVTSSVTGNRYRLTTITAWPAANDLANELGGWLWAINSSDELNDVVDQLLPARTNYMDQYNADYLAATDGDPSTVQSGLVPTGFDVVGIGNPDMDFYTGLTDSDEFSTEGTFVWTNGDPVTFLNWAGGEPNNVGIGDDPDGEDFMEVWNLTSTRNWNDDNDRNSGLQRVPSSGGALPSSDPPRLPAGGNLAVIELPPLPNPLSLEIDPTNGWAQLKWENPGPAGGPPTDIELRSYSITSESNGLDPAAWSTTNLDDDGIDVVDPNAPGQSWETVNAAVDQLFEAFLFGESIIPIDGALVLGQIMQPLPGGFGADLPDFQIDFTTENPDPTFSGNIQWTNGSVAFASVTPRVVGGTGDFDGDGDTDGSDFLKWQRDGLSAGELTEWISNYGSGAAIAAGAQTVPEPTTTALVFASVLTVSASTRRR